MSPIVSGKQFRFMQAAKSGKLKKPSIGPSPEVAKEFLSKTPKKKRSFFAKMNK